MSHKANPTQYGWSFQGSNEQSRVEFYERDGVKMDYYPTTGTQFLFNGWLGGLKMALQSDTQPSHIAAASSLHIRRLSCCALL
jgi:hypothetical protein